MLTPGNIITNGDVAAAVEAVANPAWQEDFDNTGWQTGNPGEPCRGVILCVDVTAEIVAEAVSRECNLIISHHPLLFRGVKCVVPSKGRVENVLTLLIRNGISLYSSHTALDSAPAPYGISHVLASRIGLTDVRPLTTSPGLGAIGTLPEEMTLGAFARQVMKTLGAPALRVSASPQGDRTKVKTVGLCSGAGIEFIDDAIAAGADAYLTSDVKLNWFLDRRDSIILIEAGHYETEHCVREIFAEILGKAFPQLRVIPSETENNPVNYYI